MPKNFINPEEVKTRNYKLLLYPDNEQHMKVFKLLHRSEEFKNHFVGIWHQSFDSSGNVIMSGEGKKHSHILLSLPNPVWWQSLCYRLGFINDDKTIDFRFCLPINVNHYRGKFVRDGRASLARGYCYLIHLNVPDKEQYTSRDLFGSLEMIENAQKAFDEYLMRNITMRECVYMVYDWVIQQNDYITYDIFVSWICRTPYFKAQSSPLVRGLIDERNRYILKKKAEVQQKGSFCKHYDLSDFLSIDEILDKYGGENLY